MVLEHQKIYATIGAKSISHRIHGTGIFTYIYHKFQPNVGIQCIHGSYGYRNWVFFSERSNIQNSDLTSFFPTCQVRVVRFYVSLSSFFSSPPLLLSCAGPQRRSCVCSVPRRTSTAILCVQCSAPDLNGDSVCAVFRAGPQPRSCEASVPRRTSTAIL